MFRGRIIIIIILVCSGEATADRIGSSLTGSTAVSVPGDGAQCQTSTDDDVKRRYYSKAVKSS